MTTEIETIYRELDEARRTLDWLYQINAYSLDTAEKKFRWDVEYKAAQERWDKAYAAKEALVSATLTPPRLS